VHSPSRLRIAVGGLTGAFLLAVVLGVSGVLAPARGQALGASSTVTVLGGAVSVHHRTGPVAQAVDGEVIGPGDSIETGADGRAVLTYFEGSTVEIEPGSSLSVTALSTEPDGATVVEMTQNLGRSWHVVTRILSGASKYQVRTPSATASVRGTAFQVDVVIVGGEPETTVTTSEGNVSHSAPDPRRLGQTTTINVGPGQQSSVRRGDSIAPARTAPPPDRFAVVSIGADGGLVVDAHGRANGIKDGRVVSQTPGAMVAVVDGQVRVMLPAGEDGKLATHVDKRSGSGEVTVVTTVSDSRGNTSRIEERVKTDASGKGTGGVEVKKGTDGGTELRKLGDDEKKILPSGKVARDGKVDVTTATVVADTSDQNKSGDQTKGPEQTVTGGQAQNTADQTKDEPKKPAAGESKDAEEKKSDAPGGGGPGGAGPGGGGSPGGAGQGPRPVEPQRPNPPQQPQPPSGGSVPPVNLPELPGMRPEPPVGGGDQKGPSGGDKGPSGGDRGPSGGDKGPSGGDKGPSGGDKGPSGGDKGPSGGDGGRGVGGDAGRRGSSDGGHGGGDKNGDKGTKKDDIPQR